MFGFQPSIRQKITFGYYAAVAVIIGLSAFTLMELWYIEKKVQFGGVISEFFDTTLEIRRFEKNFFLYEQDEDYQENILYVSKAQELLENALKGYESLSIVPQLSAVRETLTTYAALMEQFAHVGKRSAGQRVALKLAIREKGKEILAVAEEASKTERKRLQTLLNEIQRILVTSIIFLSLVGIAIGQLLSTVVVKSLKALENNMEKIASGGFEQISIDSKDREIVSLTTAFNKMLRELEVRQRHLIQSEKLASLGTLMAGIAHEINNPLSNISTSCQILKEEIEEADLEFKKELLSQIEDQTDRARNIVRSLLDFSREKEFKKDVLPLRSLVEETIRFIKGHIPTKVAINLDIPEDIRIFADKQRIQQAFLNLIKNAIEAMSEEGALSIRAVKRSTSSEGEIDTSKFYIFLKNHDKCDVGKRAVDIEIKDTGPGIPPEIIPKIFDPFFTTKDVGKGSGLGLSIVLEIIEEHNGCIAIESVIGRGTTFLIRLPAKE